MKIRDCITLASAQLFRRKVRFGLCALSVAVGVSSMLLISALGNMGQTYVQRTIAEMGISGLSVYVSQASEGQALTVNHAQWLADSIEEVSSAMPIKAKTATYRTAQAGGTAVMLGVDSQLGAVMNLTLVSGSLPTKTQIEQKQPVIVIDEQTAKTLYGRSDIVGKQIRFTVDGIEQYFKVIGVIKSQTAVFGEAFGAVIPTLVYVPYGCLTGQSEGVDQIFVQCISGADLHEAGSKIAQALEQRQRIGGGVSVQNVSSIFAQVQSLARAATVFFVAIAGISFFVAMLGVLSGMFSAAHEKTREIGIFIAIGAKRRDIAMVFLMQAVITCLTGSAVGIGCMWLLTEGARFAFGLPIRFSWIFAISVLGFSALCGILAGIAPAMHAARMQPVEAMRK